MDLSLEQHPPAVRRVALFEDLLTLDEGELLAGLEELAELRVGQPVEDEHLAQVADVHHMVHHMVSK